MKKLSLLVLVTCVVSLVAAPSAFAADWIPIEDAWGSATTSGNGNSLYVVSGGGGSGCVASATSYLKFDLGTVDRAIESATLNLKVTYVSWGSGAVTLSLMSVTDDSWTETSVRVDNPVVIEELASKSWAAGAKPAVGDVVTLQSVVGADERLIDFLNEQVNDDLTKLATLALRITSCATGSYEVDFGSSENVGKEPAMTLEGPLAVNVSVASAQPVTSWPLYAGLAAVALLAVAGVGLSRRRASLR